MAKFAFSSWSWSGKCIHQNVPFDQRNWNCDFRRKHLTWHIIIYIIRKKKKIYCSLSNQAPLLPLQLEDTAGVQRTICCYWTSIVVFSYSDMPGRSEVWAWLIWPYSARVSLINILFFSPKAPIDWNGGGEGNRTLDVHKSFGKPWVS